MNAIARGTSYRGLRWITLGAALLVTLLLLGVTGSSTAAHPAAPPTTPIPQQFQDVPNSNPFSAYVNALAVDHVISGYTCGGAGEPCVPPGNLPYYRPNNLVTRSQMAKFVDNGRKNISDAVGHSLLINTDAWRPLDAETTSGGEAVWAECRTANNDCYGVEGRGGAGDYSGYFYGGRGLYSDSFDTGYPAVEGYTSGTGGGTFGGEFSSDHYVALKVDAPPAAGWIQFRVDGVGTTIDAARILNGALDVEGNLTVGGSKSGYVVDAMENGDHVALEPGDVVVIAGDAAPPVNGQIPVPVVKRATSANDTGVMGVVDQVLYVPDAATKAAYDAEQAVLTAATQRRNQALADASRAGTKPDSALMQLPPVTVNDVQGTVHAIADATSAAPGGYMNVVTLGSYKAVKVDAGFGAIHAGDLLTTSPHAGYAMKVTDKAAALGAVIGKALSSLETGTGTVAVMVTLK